MFGYLFPSIIGVGGGSGAISSGELGPAAVVSGIPASGSVTGQGGGGYFVIASGTIITNDIGSGSIVSGLIASGQIGRFHVGSGQFAGFELGSGSIVSGRVASGQIGFGHLADLSVQSGKIGSGSVIGSVGGYFIIASGTLGPNDFGSGSIQSGAIASGQIGRFHIGSGQLAGFELGSGSIVSGRIASGQLADFHFASGARIDSAEWVIEDAFATTEIISGGGVGTAVAVALTQSGYLQTAMGAVSGRMPAIGIVTSNYLSGATALVHRFGRNYTTVHNFSGWTGRPVYVGRSGQLSASGAPTSSGDVQQMVGVAITASGLMVTPGDALEEVVAASGDVGSGAVTGQHGGGYFAIASGTLHRDDSASGCVIDYIACEEAISGMKAVAWGSGGCFIVRAERASGLRLPAIGIANGTFASGAVVPVVRRGLVRNSNSGTYASGLRGFLYVGSGGHLINQSGYMGGASSGEGAAPTLAGSGYSGALVQRLGWAISGGIDVQVGEVMSGLLSGQLGQW